MRSNIAKSIESMSGEVFNNNKVEKLAEAMVMARFECLLKQPMYMSLKEEEGTKLATSWLIVLGSLCDLLATCGALTGLWADSQASQW